MDAQAEMSKILGSVTGGVGAALKISKSIQGNEDEGIDGEMAAIARKTVKQKIKAIKTNKFKGGNK